MTSSSCGRDPVFDVVKALLMYFVVRGHLRAAGIVAPPATPPSAWIGAMVVGASMPCFFAISGLFAARIFERRDWPKIAARTIGILWPIASFGILFGLLLVVRGHDWGAIFSTVRYLFLSLWFLRTLAIVNIISAAAFLLSSSKMGRLALFAAVYAALVFLPQAFPGYRYWKDVMHMLPYWVFGLFFLARCLERAALRVAVTASAVFLVVAFLEGDVHTNGMGFYWISHHWRAMLLTKRGLVCFFGRTVMGMAGTIFLLWAFRWLLEKTPWLCRLAPLGTTTLGVYVIHQWILIRIGAYFHPPFPFSNGWNWCVAAVVLVACHAFISSISRIRFTRMFFFGDETVLRRLFAKLSFHPASDILPSR